MNIWHKFKHFCGIKPSYKYTFICKTCQYKNHCIGYSQMLPGSFWITCYNKHQNEYIPQDLTPMI